MPAALMQHDEDPAKLILNKIGKLDKYRVFGNQVLLGVYMRPEKTKTGIYLGDGTRKEDEHQGKAALVLKKGPSAFVSDVHYDFKGQDVELGEWVTIFVSDGRKLMINGQLCRLVEDQHIRLAVPAPDVVF